MRSLSRSVAIAGVATLAGWAHGQQYEIARQTYNGGLFGLNNHGDYVITFLDGGYFMHRGGADIAVPTASVPGYLGGGLKGVSDNGFGYGSANAGGNSSRAALWTPESGWVVMPSGPSRSQARGVTSTMRVLCAGGDTAELVHPGWWQVGQSPVNINLTSKAWACNQTGESLFHSAYGSYIMTSNDVPTELLVDGVHPTIASGFCELGLASGAVTLSGATYGVVWNKNGTVRTRTLLGESGAFYDINDSETVVGQVNMNDPDGGFIWSQSTGIRRLSSLLTPTYAGWRIVFADEINNRGQIIAVGYPPGSSSAKSVLLNPVPEPATFAPLGLGLLLLRRRKSKKSNRKR